MATTGKKRTPMKSPPTADVAILTLKVRGPGVRRGRMSVPDLIKICQDAQNAVRRQAEALEGRKTVHPRPTTNEIREECTLDLIAIRKGSTNLDFGLAKPQMTLPFADASQFGVEVVRELAGTIKSLGNGNRRQEVDPGVLQSIYGLTSVVDGGRISQIEWVAPKSGRTKYSAPINKKVRDNAAKRLSGPRFKVTKVDGVLDMADFSRKARKCRIDPAIGASVICTFGPDHETDVHALLRQPVRATGLAKIQPHSDHIDHLELQRLEPLPSLSLGEGNFFSSPTTGDLAAKQGSKPLRDLSTLAVVLDADEVEDFIGVIHEARRGDGG